MPHKAQCQSRSCGSAPSVVPYLNSYLKFTIPCLPPTILPATYDIATDAPQ